MYGTPEYNAWCSMIQRCTNYNARNFHLYGGRGIRVCDEWRYSAAAFLAWMGPKPSPKHELDRINNNGHYEPGNVRWATHKQNTDNRRVTRFISFQGETLPIKDWVTRLGLPYDLLCDRIMRQGWSVERAFLEPVEAKNQPITYDGKTLTPSGWARILGLKVGTFQKRVRVHGIPGAFTATYDRAEHMRKHRRTAGIRDSGTGRFVA